MQVLINNFEVTEFYLYPTCVIHRLVEWDEFGGAARGDDDIKELFNELLTQTEKRLGKNLHDNKIAMKVTYKPTGHEFYIGYKDWKWALGLALNPYMTGECIKLDNPINTPLIEFT